MRSGARFAASIGPDDNESRRRYEVMEVRGRAVHFGVQLQGQATSWADYAAAVKAVEELGFGSVWAFRPPPAVQWR